MLPSLSVQSLCPLSSSESRTAALCRISRRPDRSQRSGVAVCAANSSRERREISSHHHIHKDRAQHGSHRQSPPVELGRSRCGIDSTHPSRLSDLLAVGNWYKLPSLTRLLFGNAQLAGFLFDLLLAFHALYFHLQLDDLQFQFGSEDVGHLDSSNEYSFTAIVPDVAEIASNTTKV